MGIRNAVVVDASRFTNAWYLESLGEALGAELEDVRLVTRPTRPNEREIRVPSGSFEVEESFYRGSEGGSSFPEPIRLLIKGGEHARDLFELTRRLRRTPPDLVHLQWLVLPLMDRLAVRNLRSVCPVVATVHDTRPFHGEYTTCLQRIGLFRALQEVDGLHVHTEYSRRVLQDRLGTDGDTIRVIRHGRDDRRQRVGPGEGEVVSGRVVFFGAIKEYKGVDLLIDAAGNLSEDERGKLDVVLAGQVHVSREDLRERIRDRGLSDVVRLVGYVPEERLQELLGSADVFVFPYRDSDASGAFRRALEYSRPVIVSAVGEFPELVRDGRHGMIVSPGSVRELSEALRRVVRDRDEIREMAERMDEVWRRIPTWREMARSLVDWYAEVYRRVSERGDRKR